MNELKRITIFVLHHDDASDYEWVAAWIIKWKSEFKLTVHDYSTGGWEHLWDIEASDAAVAEVPAAVDNAQQRLRWLPGATPARARLTETQVL